jgi:hypothetical protein
MIAKLRTRSPAGERHQGAVGDAISIIPLFWLEGALQPNTHWQLDAWYEESG